MAHQQIEPRRQKRQQIQTVQLEAYDDVVSIRDRLQFVERRRVLLIFPAGGHNIKRKLDLLLIQREAARRRLELAILSSDPDLAEYATNIHLSCFTTLHQARSRPWKRAHSRLLSDQRPHAIHPYELRERATRLRKPLSPWARRRLLLGRVLVGGVLVVVIFGAVAAIVPSATVRLAPATDAISEPVTIIADSNSTVLDPQTNTIPAQVVRVLTQGERVTVESSGRRELRDTPAQGTVTFTNLGDTPLFIPVGTVVSTDSTPPARFATQDAAPLPPQQGASQAVAVVALEDSAGLVGNVAAGAIIRIEGEFAAAASVQNPNPTFGGGLAEEAIVTPEDHARLVTLARQAVLQAGRNDLLLQLPSQDKFLVPDAIRIVEERPEWFVYSAQVGDPAASVSLEMRAVVEAVVVDELLARQLAFLTLSQRLPPGRILDEKALSYRRTALGTDPQGRYTFQLFVEGTVPFAINRDAVAQRVSGMRVSSAKRVLENELLLDPTRPPLIAVYPFDWGLMPLLPVRIRVEVAGQ